MVEFLFVKIKVMVWCLTMPCFVLYVSFVFSFFFFLFSFFGRTSQLTYSMDRIESQKRIHVTELN